MAKAGAAGSTDTGGQEKRGGRAIVIGIVGLLFGAMIASGSLFALGRLDVGGTNGAEAKPAPEEAAHAAEEESENSAESAEDSKINYVEIERMLLPLVGAEGKLAGYASVDAALEVTGENQDFVKSRIPQVRHAINLAAWKTQLAAEPDPSFIDVPAIKGMLLRSANEALGPGRVKTVRVLGAVPV